VQSRNTGKISIPWDSQKHLRPMCPTLGELCSL
jgi:hypothetical protein